MKRQQGRVGERVRRSALSPEKLATKLRAPSAKERPEERRVALSLHCTLTSERENCSVRPSVEKDQRQPRSQVDRDRGTASWSESSLGLSVGVLPWPGGPKQVECAPSSDPGEARTLKLGAGWDELSAVFTRTREAAQLYAA